MDKRLERVDAAGLLQSALLAIRNLPLEDRARSIDWWLDALGPTWAETERTLTPLIHEDGYSAATAAFRRSQLWRLTGFWYLERAVILASQPAFAQWRWIASAYALALSDFSNEWAATVEVRVRRALPKVRMSRAYKVLRVIRGYRHDAESKAPPELPALALHQWRRLDDVRAYRDGLKRQDAALSAAVVACESEVARLFGDLSIPETDRPPYERLLSARRLLAAHERMESTDEVQSRVDRLSADLARLRAHFPPR